MPVVWSLKTNWESFNHQVTLRNSKARDEMGLIYELFKPSYAGKDVYLSLTKMFNLIKRELKIPEYFETSWD